jgi:Na+/phosphate symporter
MTDVAYYLSFALNVLLAAAAFFIVRAAVRTGRVGKAKAKLLYSVAVVVGGLLSGLVLFHAMVSLFRALGFSAEYGHGEIIIAAVVFNVLLSLIFLPVGRILLGWRPILWQ